MRVLLATDDKLARQIIETVLQRMGHHVVTCDEGREADRILRHGGCLIAILDSRLPRLSGVELVERVRGQTGGDRPYILMIAEDATEAETVRALEVGADDYVLKPVHPGALATRLRMAQKRLARRLDAHERLRSFEELLASSDELIQTAHPDGRLLFANRAWHDALGVPTGGIQEDTIFDRIAPDMREAFRRGFRRVVREHSSVRLETAFVTSRGERIPVEGSLRVKVRGRAPTSVRAHFHDVSRRKRMEAVLHTVLEGTSSATGGDFFRALARHITESLGARCGIVGEFDPADETVLRTLAVWEGKAYRPEQRIPLRGGMGSGDLAAGTASTPSLPVSYLEELGAEACLSAPMTDGRGRVTGLLCVIHDRPTHLGTDTRHVLRTFAQRAGAELERVKTQHELARRELLATALAAFERRLLAWRGTWEELQPALRHLGADAGVGRVYVFDAAEDESGRIQTSMRVEWCAAGVRPEVENPTTQDLCIDEMTPDVGSRLVAGELVLRDTASCSGRFRTILSDQGVWAFANAPMFQGDLFVGYIGFDDCDGERSWAQAECDLLTSAATALSLALERREATQRLDGILTSLRDIVWSISAGDQARLYVNSAVKQVLGHAPEAFYADPDLWMSLVHPDDRSNVAKFPDEIRAHGTGVLEYRMIRPDGEVRWLRDRGHVTLDARGLPLRFDGIARDVTEERATKRRTEAFAGLGRRLIEAATPRQAARIIFDVADELIGWDACWMDLGDPEQAVRLQPVLYMDIVDGERTEATPVLVSGGINRKTLDVVRSGGIRLLRSDEVESGIPHFGDTSRRSESLLFVPIRTSDRVVGLMSIQSYTPDNYTAADLETLCSLAAYCAGALTRTEAEEHSREAERRGRAMLDAMPDLVFRVDRQGRYLDYRARDKALLVGDSDEIVGTLLTDRLPKHAAELWMETIERVLSEGSSHHFEYDIEVRGETRRFDARMAPLAEHEVLAVTRDVTARYRAEEARLALERGILESHRLESLGVLAGGIAHDFNNLLTSIMGFASLARMKAAPGSASARYLQDIEDATQSAAELALLMLAYSGKGQFVVQPLDMRDVLSSTEGLLYSELLKLYSIIETQSADTLPAITGDQTQLQQVVLNLVLNAAQAMSPDGGVVRLRLDAVDVSEAELQGSYVGEDLPAGPCVRLEVTDTGCGMSSETLARIFDPFFTTKDDGRGLGLAAVVGIVRGHGGALRVESCPGRGTTFSIYFPATAKSVERAPQESARIMAPAGGLVLVIDDEAGVRHLTREILETSGYRVITAPDGRAGVARFREHAKDVRAVLLDLTMPRMGGVEALSVLRGLRSDVPILVSSGYCETEVVDRFDGETPDGFIQKPYTAGALLEKLDELIVNARHDTLV